MSRFFVALWAFCLAVVLVAAPVSAQEATTPDYDAWSATATRAEDAIESARASNTALESLRGQIVAWRDEFSAAQEANKALITIHQAQIDALGAKPEEGVEEDPEIVDRRAELAHEMARLQAPVVRADEAFSRANGLIAEIDRIINERQTDELISLGPTPLNPALWGNAVTDFLASLRGLWTETVSAWENPVQRTELVEDLPVVLALLLAAGVLILRGREWVRRFGEHMRARYGTGFGVWGFLISLGKIAVPLVGVFLLSEAMFATGLLGLRGSLLLSLLLPMAALFLGFRWLADRVFPAKSDQEYLILSDQKRAQMRRLTVAVALFLVAERVLGSFSTFEHYSQETKVVLLFPVIVLSAMALFRIAQIFMIAEARTTATGEDPTIRLQIVRMLARALMAIAVIGAAMAAIGYGTAATRLVVATVLSLGLFGVLQVLATFLGDLYGFITGRYEGARDALIPVLLSFVLMLASLPVFALIWGARTATLLDLWDKFKTGFQVGDAHISPTNFLTFAVIFAAGYMATRLLQSGLRTSVLPKTKIDTGGQNAIVSGTGYVGIFLAAVIAITSAGIDLSSIAIVAGALSVGIGFGLQNIVSNFVSGIILLIERPISEGDWIEVGGTHGTVRDISVRSTRIETFDRSDVIVPNSDLISGKVTNYTRGKTVGRVIVPVGVAYGTDSRVVEKILLTIAQEHPMTLSSPAPYVVFQGFGADSLDFEIRAILRDVNYVLSVRSEMNHEIAKRFAEEGIEIPFAQRDIYIKNLNDLKAGQDPENAKGQPDE